MAEKKYLNEVGLADVANHVNSRLKTVTTIPVSADDGAVRLYVGETSSTYIKGHIYQYSTTDTQWNDITISYNAGNGIDITNGEISVETNIFTGTQEEWNDLTLVEKQEYQICNITDDGSSSVNVVNSLDGSLSKIATRGQFTQFSIVPTASVDRLNQIIQYVGETTSSYTNGYFYKCILDDSTYVWDNVQVQSASGGSVVDSVNGKTGTVVLDAKDIGFQVDTMPTASITNLGQIVQYIGTTDISYTNGQFYKCVYNGSSYEWNSILVDDVYTKVQIGSLSDLPNTSKDITNNIKDIKLSVDNLEASKLSISDIDSSLSTTSENPVQNKVIALSLEQLQGSVLTKIQKKLAANADDFAIFTNDGDITDSGISKDVVPSSVSTSNKLLVASDLSVKADKVSSATNGDLAGLNASGNLTDSGISASNVVVKLSTAGLLKNDGTVDTTSYATITALSDKADKVTSATTDDFVSLDSNGNIADSGISKSIVPSGASSSNKLATANDIPTELNDLSDDVVITSPTNAQILAYNATSGKWENQTGQSAIGGAVFKGSIYFASLPTTGMLNGDWYDIKDAFTTDSTFEEGAGIACAAGTDVIWVSDDNKWNILTPSGVYSFNGRTGAVLPASGDYDASDVGLGNVVNTGDSATPVSGGTTKFTTGGAYTELNKKADKVTGTFTSGNLVSLNSSGNIADSGSKTSDFSTVKTSETAVSGGSTLSLVTTGEKYTWDNKANATVVSKTANGLAPQLPNETTTTKFLRQDGSWEVPAYPTVNNATLTIQQNDTDVQTFTANASSNASANIITDEWHKSDGSVQEFTLSVGDTTKTFTNINSSYAYKPYISCADNVAPPTLTEIKFNGTSCIVTFSEVTSAQASGSACKLKLRVVK